VIVIGFEAARRCHCHWVCATPVVHLYMESRESRGDRSHLIVERSEAILLEIEM